MRMLNLIRSSYGALQILYRMSGVINLFCRSFDRRSNCLARESAVLTSGLLNGQNLPPLADLPYGAWCVGRNGCEVIAAYNALWELGHSVTFQEIAAALERHGLLFNGFGGTNLGALADFFCQRGISMRVLYRRDRSRYDAEFSGEKCAVLSYWTGYALRRPDKSWNTLHTVSVHRVDNGVMICNVSPNQRNPVVRKSLAEFLDCQDALPVCLFLLSH